MPDRKIRRTWNIKLWIPHHDYFSDLCSSQFVLTSKSMLSPGTQLTWAPWALYSDASTELHKSSVMSGFLLLAPLQQGILKWRDKPYIYLLVHTNILNNTFLYLLPDETKVQIELPKFLGVQPSLAPQFIWCQHLYIGWSVYRLANSLCEDLFSD